MTKFRNNSLRRGWDNKSIELTIKNRYHTSSATNRANNTEATAYFNKDGSYVVRENNTGKIVQISNKKDPNWVPDSTIKNPYKPKP